MDLTLFWSHAVTEEVLFMFCSSQALGFLRHHDHDESGKQVNIRLVVGQSSEVFLGIKRLKVSVPGNWKENLPLNMETIECLSSYLLWCSEPHIFDKFCGLSRFMFCKKP